MTEPNGNNFAQKALIVLGSTVLLFMMGFFGWMAVLMIALDKKVDLVVFKVDSLLATRETQATETIQRNTRRVEQLEREVEKGKD